MAKLRIVPLPQPWKKAAAKVRLTEVMPYLACMENVLSIWLMIGNSSLLINDWYHTCDLGMNDWLTMAGTITSVVVGIAKGSHEPPSS